MKVLEGSDAVRGAVGTTLGISAWHTVSQKQIDEFARVTGDDYWIHSDVDRAALGPFGGTIAHGLLTLSLGPAFTYSIVDFIGFAGMLNYGYEKVRFTSAVRSGSRIRMRSDLLEAVHAAGRLRVVLRQTFEVADADRPACVAHSILALLTQ